MTEIELLDVVLAKTADVIEVVRPDQRSLPTPCPGYDVTALIDHLVGWVQVFEAGCHGRSHDGDPAAYRAGPDPAGDFRAASASLVAGWRDLGFDRQVRVSSGEMAGEMVFNMTLMEYLTHGWDLAVGTDQPVPYTEEEAVATLARAETTLPPEYRGEGMPFGHIVAVDADASAVDRLVGFLGRDPSCFA